MDFEFDRAEWKRQYAARDQRIGVPILRELKEADPATRQKVKNETVSYLEQCSQQEVLELGSRVIDLYSRSRTVSGNFGLKEVDLFASGTLYVLDQMGTEEAEKLTQSINTARRAVYHQHLNRLPEPLKIDF